MPISRRRPAILVTLCLAGGLAEAEERLLPRSLTGTSATVAAPLLTPVQVPVYGTQDYRITVVAAAQFTSFASDFSTSVDPATLSRYCWGWCYDYGQHYYATLDIPAGAIIDYIGVNTATTTDAVMGFTLHFRDHLGGKAELASFSFPAHGFQTDIVGPLGILVPGNHDRAFILDVEQAPSDNWQYFGYVEVWWRLVVSDPPTTPTFGDVPATHPYYQFIEALAKSGITGGCGDGSSYCPDAALTRGQMAVFLSKALGLHWPN
jgi:S-layer homology domain